MSTAYTEKTLEPCKTCGGKAYLFGKVFGRVTRWQIRHVCINVQVTTKWYDTELAAIDAWNDRNRGRA